MSRTYWQDLARQELALPFLSSAVVDGRTVACLRGPFSTAMAIGADLPFAELQVADSIRTLAVDGAPAIVMQEPELHVKTLIQPYEAAVLESYARLRRIFQDLGVDALLQVTGVLSRNHVSGLARALHPAVLSLGASRRLYEDVALVPKDIVLHGNLPAALFTGSTSEMARQAEQLRRAMRATGHPHILGTDGAILSSDALPENVEALLTL